MDEILVTITNLMRERYRDSRYCFFYGSFAYGSPNPNSDVDLIIVYDKTVMSYREKFVYEDLLMDVFVYDEETLSGTLHMSRVNGKFVTVDAVISAITLPAPTEQSELLKNVASRVRRAGYIFTNRAFMQQYITNIIDDLEDVMVVSERNMLCVDLYKATIEIILIGGGAGVCDRKHAARELTRIDAEMHGRLDRHLLTALSGDAHFIVQTAKEVLAMIGGPLRAGFHLNNPTAVRMPIPVL